MDSGIRSAAAAVPHVPPVGETASRARASRLATLEESGAVGIALARPGPAPRQALPGVAAARASADPISAVRLSQDHASATPRLDLFRTLDSDPILAARASILSAIGDTAIEGSTDLATVGAEASGQVTAEVVSSSAAGGVGAAGALAWDGHTGGAAIGDQAGR